MGIKPMEMQTSTVGSDVREKINALSREVSGEPSEPVKEESPKEIPQPPVAEKPQEQPVKNQAEEADDSEQADEAIADPKRKNRAQERIRQLNAEKNALAEQLQQFAQYMPVINEYQKSIQEQQKPQFQEFTSQEEFFQAVKEQAKREAIEEISKVINPVVADTTNAKYQKQINNWFDGNPEAKTAKKEMEEFASQLSTEETEFYQKQILNGNSRVLNMIYKAVKPDAVKADNSEIVRSAIQKDQEKVGISSSRKSTKATEDTSSYMDDLAEAQKTGNFSKILSKHVIRQK